MIKTLIALLISVLLPSSAWAAIANVANLGTATSISAGTSLVLTTAAALDVGNIGLLSIATDNTGTTDADHSEITSVVDSVGNTYGKICEFTNGNAGAAAGATVAIYRTRATTELGIGGTVTITFANTVTSKAASLREFTVGAGNTLQVAGTCQTGVNDATFNLASLVISGLSNKEYLFYRQMGSEHTGFNITPTTNFTEDDGIDADTGSNATSMCVRGEWRIVTATGATSEPTTANTSDSVSIFVALEEVVVPASRRPIPPFIFL